MPNMTALNGNNRGQFFGMKSMPDIVPSASAASQVSYNGRILGNILNDKLEERRENLAGPGGLRSIQSVGSILSG